MSGHGSFSAIGRDMNVPYDKWGREIEYELILDEDGKPIGHYQDAIRYVQADDVRTITKKEILEEVSGWKKDDGTYGDEEGDVNIYIQYKNGKLLHLTDTKRTTFSRSGIIGVSVTTADYDMVWGHEMMKVGTLVPFESSWLSGGSKSYTNSYAGRKTIGEYKVREKVIYNPYKNGNVKQVTHIVRKSTVKYYK